MLQETTGYIICRTARKIHQFMTKVLADYDITPEQWVVLQIVSKEKNLSQQELAARLEKDKNSTKALVDRLIKKELLTRQKDDSDKRFYKLQATPAGIFLTKTGKTWLWLYAGNRIWAYRRGINQLYKNPH